MRIIELAWIGAFARSLDLDETHKRVADGNRVVRTRLQLGERRFSDETHGTGGQPADLGQVSHQRFERRAELVFRCPLIAILVSLGFRLAPYWETAAATVFPAKSASCQ